MFRCFEPKSKQPKQTDLFRNKPKQTETTLKFWKNFQIYSLLNCLGGSWFGSIETPKQPKQTVSKQIEKTEKNEKTEKKKKSEKKPEKNRKKSEKLYIFCKK